MHGRVGAMRRMLVDLFVGIEQRVHSPVADAVGRELQARRDGLVHDRHQPLARNEKHAAIARVVDRVDLAHAPGLAHVGTAGEHAAVEIGLDPDDPQSRPAVTKRMSRHPADLFEDLVERAQCLDVVRDAEPDRQGAGLVHFLVAIDGRCVGVAIDDGRDPDRIVVREQLDQPPLLILLGRLVLGRRHFDVPGAVAEDAGRLAGARVLFDLARSVDPEILVDAAELERQRVDRGIGPGREQHGVLGRGLVQLVASRVALLFEPGDEDLADDDPSLRAQGLGPSTNVIEHVRDRLHLGDRMVELGHAGVGRDGRANRSGPARPSCRRGRRGSCSVRAVLRTSSLVPTWISRSPLTARAWRIEKSRSTVTILP